MVGGWPWRNFIFRDPSQPLDYTQSGQNVAITMCFEITESIFSELLQFFQNLILVSLPPSSLDDEFNQENWLPYLFSGIKCLEFHFYELLPLTFEPSYSYCEHHLFHQSTHMHLLWYSWRLYCKWKRFLWL